jgi:hypothetical protein
VPTQDEIYTAIRNADKAGDSDSVRKLGAYLQTMQMLPKPAAPPPLDPTEGMSGADKFFAGVGKGMTDVVRGVGQVARHVLPTSVADAIGAPTQADIDNAKERDAPLMRSGAAVSGDITGSIAAAVPAMFIPGAGTLGGAAAIGAGLGAVQPVASDESRLMNTAVGGLAGAGGVVAGRVAGALWKGGKALIEPFTERGRQNIAGRTLDRFGVKPQDVANVSNAPTITGAKPTLAEAIQDPEGAAAAARLQDSLGSVDPNIRGAIDARAGQNNAARVATLQDLAGTNGARDAAVAAREKVANQLYGNARAQGADASAVSDLNSRLQAEGAKVLREHVEQLRADSGFDPYSGAAGNKNTSDIAKSMDINSKAADEFQAASVNKGKGYIGGVDISDLLSRPALRDAIGGASRTAADFGESISSANPVSVLHYAKMGLDGQISEAVRAGNNTKAASLMSARQALLGRLEEISPTYKQASQTYADMSKPINQMDVAQQVLTKGTANTTDLSGTPRIMPNAITGQMKDEGRLIQSATGRNGTKLADLLDPDQLTRLQAVADEADKSAAVARAGNGPGSATAQRLASGNILRQVIGPTGLPHSWAESTLLHSLMRPVQFAYNGVAEPKIQQTLADLILNPEKAKAALATLQPAARTKLSALLRSPSLQQAAKSLAPATALDDPSAKSFEQKAF